MSNISGGGGGGGLDDGENFDGQGTSEFSNVKAFDTDEINRTVWVDPNEDIQTVMDGLEAPSGSADYNVVRLYPRTTYTRDTTLAVPEQTILDLNGAGILHQADVDGVSLSAPKAELHGPGGVTAWGSSLTYTSNLVKVDTASGNFSNGLNPQWQNTVKIRGYPALRNNDPDSTLLQLDSSGQQLLMGNLFEIQTQGGQHHVEFRANNGNAINGTEVHILGWQSNGQHIVRTNTAGAAGANRSLVYGHLQGDSDATNLLANTVADAKAFNFYGQLWDSHLLTGNATTGQGLRVTSPTVGGFNYDHEAGTVVNGLSKRSLAGGSPDATNYIAGDMVQDLDNLGTLYYIYDNENAGDHVQLTP